MNDEHDVECTHPDAEPGGNLGGDMNDPRCTECGAAVYWYEGRWLDR